MKRTNSNGGDMLEPLKQWVCDRCGGVIERAEDGWLEWVEKDGVSFGFRIVHHSTLSPRKGAGCYHYDDDPDRCDMHLDHVLEYGLVWIYSLIDVGPHHQPQYRGPRVADLRELLEVARRLTLPYYEEARCHWGAALADGYLDGMNEIAVYSEPFLRGIVERYHNWTESEAAAPIQEGPDA